MDSGAVEIPELNVSVLNALCGGDSGFLGELMAILQEQLDEFTGVCSTPDDGADYVARLQLLSHRLRGSAGALGLQRLTQGLTALEQQAKGVASTGEGRAELLKALPSIVEECNRGMAALHGYAASLGKGV